MNFQDINLIIQTTMMAVLLVSMWFRAKGNYLVHGATMIGVVAAQLIGVLVVFATTPISAMEPITSVLLNMDMFAVHAFFGAASIGAGVVLVALWRPKSTTFPTRSKKIALATAVLWILTFVIGIVMGLTLHSGFFI